MAKYEWHICPPPPEYRLKVGVATFVFEMHPYLGPAVLDRKGNPIKGTGLPPERSPFWGAFQRWMDGGQQADSQGNCILPTPDTPTPPDMPPEARGL
jgi:hypothetical protein